MGPPMPFGVRGDHGFGDSFSVLPFLAGAVLVALLLLLATGLYRAHRERSAQPALPAAVTPDDEARRIIAERFARSEITSDEFLERASILNWTPGSDQFSPRFRRPPR
jgi:putative membrane protein